MHLALQNALTEFLALHGMVWGNSPNGSVNLRNLTRSRIGLD
jgi:hypothetical protein